MKNLSKKQLIDIISLSILAATSESDPTEVQDNKFYGKISTNTPYIQELLFILNEDNNEKAHEIQSFVISANEHIAAIRLGMRIARESEE
jgi:hypothetical protein